MSAPLATRGDLVRRVCSRQGSAVRRNAVYGFSDDGKDGVARSAGTRRMVGRMRGGISRAVGRQSGGAASRAGRSAGSHVIERCDRRFSHKASPARRGRSRQDVSFTCGPKSASNARGTMSFRVVVPFQFRLCRLARSSTRFIPAVLFFTVAIVSCASLFKAPWEAREISTQDDRPHLAMSCNTHKTRKASLTYKPSLIWWSALVLRSL